MIRLSDVAHCFDIPLSTVRRWVSEGKLKKYGKKPYFVDLEDVQKCLDARPPSPER